MYKFLMLALTAVWTWLFSEKCSRILFSVTGHLLPCNNSMVQNSFKETLQAIIMTEGQ